MSDSALALLAAVVAALGATSGVTAVVGSRIYSDVPDNPVFPFIHVSLTSAPYDTKTSTGMLHTVQVSTFSRKRTPSEALTARAAVYAALNRNEAALSAASVRILEYSGLATAFKEPDGATWQSVIQFRAVIG